MEKDLKNKTELFLGKYLDCLNKAADIFMKGESLDDKTLFALHDGVRTIHHIISMEKSEKKPL